MIFLKEKTSQLEYNNVLYNLILNHICIMEHKLFTLCFIINIIIIIDNMLNH